MAIIGDLVNGSRSNADKMGETFTSSLVVSELSLAASPIQLSDAVLQAGFIIGDQHPQYPDFVLINIDSRHNGVNSVEIIYTWDKRFPEVQYETGSTVVNEQTNLDKDGNIITATYTYPDGYKQNPELAGEEFTTSVLIDKLVPETTIAVIRQERITGGELATKSLTYTGTVNADFWSLFSSGPRTWLCSGIAGTSQDNGTTYTVRYSFIYRPIRAIADPDTGVISYRQGWDREVVFVDPQTNEPPSDALPEVYKIYPETNFNDLGLS